MLFIQLNEVEFTMKFMVKLAAFAAAAASGHRLLCEQAKLYDYWHHFEYGLDIFGGIANNGPWQ